MGSRVKVTEVLNPNVVTEVDLEAEVIGSWRATGPNRWDDWELLPETDGEVVQIPAGNHLLLEPLGAAPELRLRMRRGREVLRLRWRLTAEDQERLATGQWGVRESEQATVLERIFGTGPKDDPRDDLLEYFLDVKVRPLEVEKGSGYTVAIIKKLLGK